MAGEINSCPACHSLVPEAAYFCPNCGKRLREKPPSTSASSQAVVYLVSLFLPPFGLWYVWKYLRQPDKRSKTIGIAALALTAFSVAATVWMTEALLNTINQYMYNIMGF